MDGDSDYPSLLANRYRLGRLIGEGGMGAVFECIDTQGPNPQKYAVKLIKLEQLMSSAGLKGFRNECEVLTRLDHPNIVKTFDYGVADEWPFLVMELCRDRGLRPTSLKSLQERFAEHRLPPPVLEVVIPQILAALAEVHANGLIHRDVKPDNFLVRETLRGALALKLTDFGLAMEGGIVQAMAGTFDYMSPEQRAGEALDPRTDVYSAGLMIYRLATGYERLGYENPSDVDPAIPKWVDNLVDQAVKDDRKERPADCRALLAMVPPDVLAAAHVAMSDVHKNPLQRRGLQTDEDANILPSHDAQPALQDLLLRPGAVANPAVSGPATISPWAQAGVGLVGYIAGIAVAVALLLMGLQKLLILPLVDIPVRLARAGLHYGAGIFLRVLPGSDYMVGGRYGMMDDVIGEGVAVVPYFAAFTGLVVCSLLLSLTQGLWRIGAILFTIVVAVLACIESTQPIALCGGALLAGYLPFLFALRLALRPHTGFAVSIPAGLSGAALVALLYVFTTIPSHIDYDTDRRIGSFPGTALLLKAQGGPSLNPAANWIPGKWPVASGYRYGKNVESVGFSGVDTNGQQLSRVNIRVYSLDGPLPPLSGLTNDENGETYLAVTPAANGFPMVPVSSLPPGRYRTRLDAVGGKDVYWQLEAHAVSAYSGFPWRPALTYELGFFAVSQAGITIEVLTALLTVITGLIALAVPVLILLQPLLRRKSP